MPTRLIDLSTSNSSDLVKLISSRLLRTRSVYATLSYCWGGDQSVKTTKSTLEQHQIGIQVNTLGRTLQDAIKVARSIGIHFLWVDSLCIIQDDSEDVSTEISKMLEYYENSHVSICAATASHSNEGFLAPRDENPYQNGPFELPYRGPDNHLGSIELAQYLKYCSSQEPVKSRAWILQESLLAPRVLSYSYRSLAWSCRKQNLNDG
jgi:Heterokaryon incompatibility protein (HET)